MYDINYIVDYTSLGKQFVYRCLLKKNGIRPVFGDSLSENDKGQLSFDSNGLKIWDKIMQLKQEKHSLPEIRKRLLKSFPQDDKELIKPNKSSQIKVNKPSQVLINDNDSKADIIDIMRENQLLKEKLYEADLRTEKIQHELNLLQNDMKLLPAGGDPKNYAKVLAMVDRFERESLKNEQGFIPIDIFGKKRRKKEEWRQLKELLEGKGEAETI